MNPPNPHITATPTLPVPAPASAPLPRKSLRLRPLSIRATLATLAGEVYAVLATSPQPTLEAEIRADHVRETAALVLLSANLGACFWLLY